jgi:hypothetical protein
MIWEGAREALACNPDLDPCQFDSPREDWEEAGWAAEIACYRDWTGRRVFGVLGEVTVASAELAGHYSVDFSITQVDHIEEAISVGPVIEQPPSPAPPPAPEENP